MKKIKEYKETCEKITNLSSKIHQEMRTYISSMHTHKDDMGVQLRIDNYNHIKYEDEIVFSVYKSQGGNLQFKLEQINDLISLLQEFRSKVNEER